MNLYDNWLKMAYNKDGVSLPELWEVYMPLEQKIYEDIIGNNITKLEGTVKELADRYGVNIEYVCGFLDGINDATGNTVKIEDIEETTKIELEIDYEKLYKKMVEYKAEHLYELPQWDKHFTIEVRRNMFLEQKKSGTFINKSKIGRNDLCTCGSGKKYKYCCGA